MASNVKQVTVPALSVQQNSRPLHSRIQCHWSSVQMIP